MAIDFRNYYLFELSIGFIVLVYGGSVITKNWIIGWVSITLAVFLVYDRQPGTAEGYNKYSKGLVKYGADKVWQDDNLDRFLENSRKEVKGTRMRIKLKKAKDRKDVIEYLKANSPKKDSKDS